ncbi:hypothetical protein QMY33_14695 [Pseudomonas aeruginosa]|nr:hypothetical protein [Pseudomonas aeruginosa]
MSNELTDVRCPCGDEYPADSYDAGFIAGSGMCQNCDAALPPKDICTCPSGDGSLRWPCPKHPAVEQAGGDERDLQGAQGERDGWGPLPIVQVPWNVFDQAVMWVEDRRRYGDDGTIVDDWKALKTIQRAALAQPSPAPADEKPGDSILCSGCFAKGVGPEHFDEAGKCLVRQQTEPLGAEFAQVLSDNLPELLSTAQAEQAEAERPEVVAWRYGFSGGIVSDKACLDEWKSGGEYQSLMTVAQHGRIVGALRARNEKLEADAGALEWLRSTFKVHKAIVEQAGCGTIEQLAEQRDAANSRLHEVSVACATAEQERDAALARVAELEKQEPVATIAKVPGEDWNGLHFYRDPQDMQPGTKLYAAPVAQAQQLHDLDAQCRDDVARALGLRQSQERGFAWSYLLASIKSCVKASEDAAQAQHSVPDELRAICMLVAETGIKYGRGRHRAVAADECRAVVNAVLNADLSVGRACEYAGCCDKAHPGTSLCIAHHSKKAREQLLAAAPGNSAQHSVPEGWMLVECGIWTQEQVDEMQKTVARFRNSEFVDDRALAMAVADAGQCKAPEISLAELLAAAPGKEGG